MKRFFSRIILLISMFYIHSTLFAQHKEDMIYLSNGSVIHGVLLAPLTPTSVRILNNAGDIWVFQRKEIDSITRENPIDYKATLFNQKGFEFELNAELLSRSGANAVGQAVIPGINMALAFRQNQYLTAGGEIGVEFYDHMEIPVSAAIRIRTSWGKTVTPLLLFRMGYTFAGEKRADDWEYSYKSIGGIHISVGSGFERVINQNASFLFTLSYHYQELNYHLSPINQWSQERDRTETYSRFRLTIGYVFK